MKTAWFWMPLYELYFEQCNETNKISGTENILENFVLEILVYRVAIFGRTQNWFKYYKRRNEKKVGKAYEYGKSFELT